LKKIIAMLIVFMLVLPIAAHADAKTGETIAWKAMTYQGKVSYVFGRNDPAHLVFDCSSFTKFIIGQYGIHIPWSSRAQSKIGTYVNRNNLRSGDLVFFSVGTPGQVNHVGIYTGNGMFISDLPRRGLVVASMNSPHWKSHYITARRVT
jgi:lipoprotein Spr